MVQRPPPLTECPKSPDSLHFATYWYRISCVPDFLVCTKCYEEKVAQSPFASAFEVFYHTPVPGKKASCLFNCSTVNRIFGNAVQYSYNDPHAHALATLFAVARQRVCVKDCPGTDGSSAEQAIRWYGVHQIPDFMVCEACYLDYVSDSSLLANFVPYPTQQPHNQTWSCDMAVPNIRRHLIENSKRSDWAGFVNAVSHRLHLPKCDGSEQSLTQRNWYTPAALPNLLICETCYLDEISLTSNMSEFRSLRSSWTHTPPSNVTGRCSLAYLGVSICSNQLLERNFAQWIQLIGRMLTLPPCGQNIHDGDWLMLINPWTHQATDFGLCEGCYVGCVESSNNGHMFRRERLPALGYCEFSPSNPRRGASVQKFIELLFTRDSTRLIEYATHLQPQPAALVQTQNQTPQNTQQDAPGGTSNWQAISAQLANQHAFNMGLSNMVFAQNTMHNATMQGIWSQGSSYNSWYDPVHNQAQMNYTHAQNQVFTAMLNRK